jgi:hypothetical protein
MAFSAQYYSTLPASHRLGRGTAIKAEKRKLTRALQTCISSAAVAEFFEGTCICNFTPLAGRISVWPTGAGGSNAFQDHPNLSKPGGRSATMPAAF